MITDRTREIAAWLFPRTPREVWIDIPHYKPEGTAEFRVDHASAWCHVEIGFQHTPSQIRVEDHRHGKVLFLDPNAPDLFEALGRVFAEAGMALGQPRQ